VDVTGHLWTCTFPCAARGTPLLCPRYSLALPAARMGRMLRRAKSSTYFGMEAPLDLASYKAALIVLAAAGVVIPLFHRLKLSPALGFMLVGFIVGPYGLGALVGAHPWLRLVTIAESASIRQIADLGVVLLLFMIGLELSLERLWLMRRLVFGLGVLQVAACAAALTGSGVLLGEPPVRAAVIGLALAMSSTAIVLQVLAEEKRLGTPAGRATVCPVFSSRPSRRFHASLVSMRLAGTRSSASGIQKRRSMRVASYSTSTATSSAKPMT